MLFYVYLSFLIRTQQYILFTRKEANMPKEKSPPVNLDKYLEGRNHKYMTYEKASRLYGLPFWGFVSVAKEAKATCSHIGVRPQCGQFTVNLREGVSV